MAIGDTNTNNSNQGKLYENTYYPRIRIRNAESKLSLNTSFRSGLLILEICELKEGFKYDPIIAIYLSPTKAKLFAKEIEKFIAYLESGEIVEGKAFGVNAGMNDKVSFIAIHADTNKNIFISIGKFDSQGMITENHTIGLNKEYHFSLEWDNLDTMDVVKVHDDMIEVEQLYELCKDFGRSMNGAQAYAYADLARFDNVRILRKMDPIYDKLGIERLNPKGNGGSYSSKNNFLDSAKSSSSNHMSFDDMESLMD